MSNALQDILLYLFFFTLINSIFPIAFLTNMRSIPCHSAFTTFKDYSVILYISHKCIFFYSFMGFVDYIVSSTFNEQDMKR